MLVVLAVIHRRSVRRAAAFQTANKAAFDALTRGALDDARATWTRWADTPGTPRISAMAGHNLAWVQLREGDLARAIATLDSNEARHLSALTAIGLAATSAADRALAHALSGQLAEAETWIERAEARLLHATMPSAGAIALAHATLNCRAGRIPAATKLLADGWAQIEATTSDDVLRPLRIVHAFALAAAGRSPASALADLRPAYATEFAFLGAAWPEMAAFLTAHHLAS